MPAPSASPSSPVSMGVTRGRMVREEVHLPGEVGVHLARVRPRAGPPILLVPGLGATPAPFGLHPRRSVVDLVADLGRTPWTLDFEVSWHGRSQGAEAMLAALERAIDALGPCDAVGHSLGGILLLGAVARGAPIGRLVTMATAIDYRLGRSPLPRLLSLAPKGLGPVRLGLRRGGVPVRAMAVLAAPLFGRGLRLPVESDQFYPGTTSPALRRRAVREGARDLPLALLLDLAALFTERGLVLGGEPLTDAVRAIDRPVLMIAGRQDRQCPLKAVRDAARRVPGAKLVEVGDDAFGEGYGHLDLLLGRRSPEDVLPHLERFLGEAPQREAPWNRRSTTSTTARAGGSS